jgi:hypothetical protein
VAGTAGVLGPVELMAFARLAHGPDPEEVAAWLRRSCARSDVPERVTDPDTLRQVGVLLGAGTGGRPRQAKRAAAHRPLRLDSPDWLDSVGVESLSASDRSWVYDDVIDQSSHDGDLSGEVQALPPVA